MTGAKKIKKVKRGRMKTKKVELEELGKSMSLRSRKGEH
jgi:hypothetical protein